MRMLQTQPLHSYQSNLMTSLTKPPHSSVTIESGTMNELNFTHNKFYLLQYVRKNDYFLEKMGEEVKTIE